MSRFVLILIASLVAAAIAALAHGNDNIATLRSVPIDEEAQPPMIGRTVNSDVKPRRNYPMQPPMIPHKIDGYQVDRNVNTCMSCHSRKAMADSQATMVSVTHYMDRDGNFLASISPRRYFCQQCHVTQTEARPLLENEFVDVDELLSRAQSGGH